MFDTDTVRWGGWGKQFAVYTTPHTPSASLLPNPTPILLQRAIRTAMAAEATMGGRGWGGRGRGRVGAMSMVRWDKAVGTIMVVKEEEEEEEG